MKDLKNKERNIKEIMIKLSIKTVIIIAMTSMIFTCFAPHYFYEEDLSNMLGLTKIEIETKTTIDPFVIGYPYQMEIYTLSNKTIEQFFVKPSKEFSIERFERKKGWEKIGWNKTPIDTLYNGFFKLALSWDSFDKKRLPKESDKIAKAAKTKGSFYAFYRDDKNYTEYFCFVLLNTSDHKLYIINFTNDH